MKQRNPLSMVLALFALSFASLSAVAQPSPAGPAECKGLPTHHQLLVALAAARAQTNGGFNLDMWGVVVNRDGVVCAVAFTGADRGSQWPGSRNIAAQKANTANAFSLPQLALSTANLYTATQPGGSLFGLQASNPVDPFVAYRGDPELYGQLNDPMIGGRIGGVDVFGGGLGLYNAQKVLIGGLGVSGDSSCADHNIAWRTRHSLNLDFVPAGVSGDSARPDNIVYDIVQAPGFQIGSSPSGWGHPACSSAATSIAANLPAVQ
ncbi:MAG TPA: heme-binding protein [Acidobacteriaceae bacterium]|nr:heme-binding protein [Acidobacteriaceae bacterium]